MDVNGSAPACVGCATADQTALVLTTFRDDDPENGTATDAETLGLTGNVLGQSGGVRTRRDACLRRRHRIPPRSSPPGRCRPSRLTELAEPLVGRRRRGSRRSSCSS